MHNKRMLSPLRGWDLLTVGPKYGRYVFSKKQFHFRPGEFESVKFNISPINMSINYE